MATQIETKETAAVDKYDGSNFPMWKMHMSFIFQSKDLFSIVDGTATKEDSFDPAAWERKDKTAAVAILSALSTKYKAEVSHCRTSAEMWFQLLTFYDRNSVESIVGLQEKFYKCTLDEFDSVISYISTLQNLARQLTELGEVISERQVISKIRSGLPPSYDSFLFAWDSVPLAEQTLRGFQSRVVKREDTLKERNGRTDVQLEQAFYSKTSTHSSSRRSSSRPELTTEQKKAKALRLQKLKKNSRCHACGHHGHFSGDKECPANASNSDDSHSEPEFRSHSSKGKKHVRSKSSHSR